MSTSTSPGYVSNGLTLSIGTASDKAYKGPAIQNIATSLQSNGTGTAAGYSAIALTETVNIPSLGDTTVASTLIQNIFTVANTYWFTSTTSLTIATGNQAFSITGPGIGNGPILANGLRIRAYNTGTPANFMEGPIYSVVGGPNAFVVTLTVDTIGGSGAIAAWSFSMANNSGTCCPAILTYSNGLNNIPVSASTLYTYAIVYYCASGNTGPNYMYRLEWSATSTVVKEGGVFNNANRIHLGNGWYWAWGTFTTQSNAVYISAHAYYYRYSINYDKLSVAKVLITPGNYTTLHPKYWPAFNTTRTTSQMLLDNVGNKTITTNNLVYAKDGTHSFNGVSSYISVGNLGTMYANGTISVWFYSRSVTNYCNIYQTNSGGSGNSGIRIEQYTDGTLRVVIGNDAGTFDSIYTAGIRSNTWYNLVVTWVTSTGATVAYLNNVATSQTIAYWATTMPNVLIGTGFGGTRYFNGSISDFKVYNRTLSAIEVAQNYNATKGLYMSDLVTNGVVLNLDTGLATSYPGTGTAWNDLSGNGLNATLTNSPIYNIANAGSFYFDGVSKYAVTTSDSSNPTAGITLSQWVKFTSYSTMVSLSKGAKIAGHYEIWFYNGQLQFYAPDLGTGGYQNSNYSVNKGSWQYVTVTYDKATVKFFVNGVIIGTASLIGSILPMTATIDIGRSATSGLYFNGLIANSMIYNRALTELEVLKNYNSLKTRYIERPLLVHLDAANTASYPGTGTTWTDLSGNGVHGTLVNGPTYNSANGGSIVFDGVNDNVTFPNVTIPNSTCVTVEVWFYSTNGTVYQDLFDVSDTYGIWITLNASWTGGAAGKISTSFTTTTNPIHTTYTLNQWNQIVIVGNNGTVSQYLNGSLTGTVAQNAVANINFNTARLGNVDGDRSSEYFAGNISILKIYDGALTADEIAQNFNAYRGRYGI